MDEIRLHRQTSLPEQVPKLHLLLIVKDKLGHSRLTGIRPHQLTGRLDPPKDLTIIVSNDDQIITNS